MTGIAGRMAAVLVGLITLPLTVRYLGALEYGIWVTISSSVVMLAVLDLGIASSLTNSISRAFAESDPESAQRDYSTAFWVACGVAALLGIAGLLIFPWINWASVFHLSDPSVARQAGRCAAVSFAFFVLSMPLGLINKVLGGYQRVPVANAFSALSSVLSLAAILLVINLHGGIVLLALAFCMSMLLGNVLANLWVAFRHEPRIRAHPRAFRKDAAKSMLQQGLPFFVLQLAGIVVFSSDNFVIAHYLGASEVTPYSVAWRLTSYAGMLQNLFVPSLWPAFTEAYLRGDMGWLRTTYRRIMKGTMLSVGLGSLMAALFGRWAIRHWAGPTAVPDSTLLWCMCLWAVIVAYTINQAALMAATQQLRLQAISSSLAAVLNLTLSIILVQHIGALGVLLATLLSYVLLVLAPQMWEVHQILAGVYLRNDARSGHAPPPGPLWKRLLRPIRETAGRLLVHGRIYRLYAPQAAPEQAGEPRKVALSNLIGNLGDQVMMLPVLDALHAENPDLHITYFSDPIASFLALHPAVSELCLIPRAASKPHPVIRILRNIGIWKQQFRAKHFHTVVVPRGGVDPFGSHHFAWMLGGHSRFSYATALEPERPAFQFHVSSLFTAEVTEKRRVHEVERVSEVLQLAGLLSQPINIYKTSNSLVSIAGSVEGEAFVRKHGLPLREYAILAPGSSMARRAWPAASFTEVARRAFLCRGWLPVIVGGPEIAALAEDMLAELGDGLNLAGETNFVQLAAVCAGAKCFVGNDSGTGHVAGAAGVPTVIVTAYARSSPPADHASPLRSHPVGPSVAFVQPEVPRFPCVYECVADDAHCIATVTVEEVEASLQRLLGHSDTPSR